MHRTIRILTVFAVCFAFLMPPPPAYGETDAGAMLQIFKKLITPSQNDKLFINVQSSRAIRHIENGSIWEKDRSEHGGPQWKFWPNRKSWEKNEESSSIWPDGRIRKEGRSGGLPMEWQMRLRKE